MAEKTRKPAATKPKAAVRKAGTTVKQSAEKNVEQGIEQVGRKSRTVIADARKKGETVITTARKRGEAVIADARKTGEAALRTARKHGEAVIADARDRSEAVISTARKRGGAAISSVREKSGAVIEDTREKTARAAAETNRLFQEHPITAVAAAVAAGAVLGIFLPRFNITNRAGKLAGRAIKAAAANEAAQRVWSGVRDSGKPEDETGTD